MIGRRLLTICDRERTSEPDFARKPHLQTQSVAVAIGLNFQRVEVIQK
ncbi:MAG: hypothetical protein KME35_23450 [Aphanocapsa sp. GSE-SYN-MK-11-07L]|nr:hypothetical protein [Aphanocapsa sp. GSE-SYN-MK-11-07L]